MIVEALQIEVNHAYHPTERTRHSRLTTRVSGESLNVFRVIFGAVGLISAVRILWFGWAGSLYSEPARHLRYPMMSWVPTLHAPFMQALVVVIALSATAVMVGFRYRIAIIVFWLSFTWLEFMEASVYLNHYWFIVVMGALMIVLPMADKIVPMGAVWLVRFQIGIVYIFAGIAKLSSDWLIHGLPMKLWLQTPLLANPTTAVLLSWAGAIFDLTVVPFLLWRRTRLVAWLAVVAFHLVTWFLFPVIGVFPLLMIGASTVFFDPDWPAVFRRRQPQPSPEPRPVSRFVLAATALWIVVQLALPLRHFAYPGDYRWTANGNRFGWNVLPAEKAGDISFRVTSASHTARTTRTDATDLYTAQQWRVMVTEPEFIRQAAHAVAESQPRDVEVRVDSFVSFNGRTPQRMIDPDVDLAAEPWRITAQRWIRPAR